MRWKTPLNCQRDMSHSNERTRCYSANRFARFYNKIIEIGAPSFISGENVQSRERKSCTSWFGTNRGYLNRAGRGARLWSPPTNTQVVPTTWNWLPQSEAECVYSQAAMNISNLKFSFQSLALQRATEHICYQARSGWQSHILLGMLRVLGGLWMRDTCRVLHWELRRGRSVRLCWP